MTLLLGMNNEAAGIVTGEEAERIGLNYMGRLSGIATATAAFVEKTTGTKAHIVCTRKTTPGLRAFEKHAVLCGGGRNHRFGLFDAVLIKPISLQMVRDVVGSLFPG